MVTPAGSGAAVGVGLGVAAAVGVCAVGVAALSLSDAPSPPQAASSNESARVSNKVAVNGFARSLRCVGGLAMGLHLLPGSVRSIRFRRASNDG